MKGEGEMMILKSKHYVDALYQTLQKEIEKLAKQPRLVIVQIGNDKASAVYVKQKQIRAEAIGILTSHHHFDEMTESELIAHIQKLNTDVTVTGYIIQLPLPEHIALERVLPYIDPAKDADGFHPFNVGQVALKQSGVLPCTPKGIIWLLEQSGVSLSKKSAVVIGRSHLVGQPVGLLLLQKDVTVTFCHTKTVNLTAYTKEADIVIAAAGVAKMVTAEMVKDGAIIIDVGIHRLEDGSLCGDVDFIPVSQKAALITPVPGGVGPVTVAMLMQNIVEMAKLSQ